MRQSLSAKCSTLVNVLNGVNSCSADVSVDVDLLTPANLSFHLCRIVQSKHYLFVSFLQKLPRLRKSPFLNSSWRRLIT